MDVPITWSWRRAPSVALAQLSGADGDGDGMIGDGDYVVWSSNLDGRYAASLFATSKVPEPATCNIVCGRALRDCRRPTRMRIAVPR